MRNNLLDVSVKCADFARGTAMAFLLLFASSCGGGEKGLDDDTETAVEADTETEFDEVQDPKLVLWYDEPAVDWETQALPIGNGRLGAMVFGGVDAEKLQLNEDSLWTGDETTFGAYQSLGDIDIVFAHDGDADDYRRSLDIENAVARVSYEAGGVAFEREYFASYPGQVIVMRVSCDVPGGITADISLTDAHDGDMDVSEDEISVVGRLTALSYAAILKVIQKGGRLVSDRNGIGVRDADELTLLLASRTDYDPDPTSVEYIGEPPEPRVREDIDAAAELSYETLKQSHIRDYRRLFSKVELDLGQERPGVPTDELLQNYDGDDPRLEVLYFQYGRYLLICSSRPGSLPANLQGLWNNSNTPPWNCDYHSNINVQMAYWQAETANLSECHEPLFDYIAKQQPAWTTLAEGAGALGWILRTENNIFGMSNWEWNRPANAWYSMHLFEHYRFTLDESFLSDRAYPIMKSACELWLDTLVEDADGTLVAPDEWSPEHGPWEPGLPYAQQLIWDLFNNTIEAARILDIDESFQSELEAALGVLDPGVAVGEFGQLKEWKYTEDDPSDQHRHISHLIALHPGRQISPLIDTTFSDAAAVSLEARGDGGTGWAKAWKINTWARLFDGDRAHRLLGEQLEESTLQNLFDTHPPFQIDGNLGATAGVTEMLIQSHIVIHLLPALPGTWPDGAVRGLRARGGFEVSMTWAERSLKEATIVSLAGQRARIKCAAFDGGVVVTRAEDGEVVEHDKDGDTIELDTKKGETYRIVVE